AEEFPRADVQVEGRQRVDPAPLHEEMLLDSAQADFRRAVQGRSGLVASAHGLKPLLSGYRRRPRPPATGACIAAARSDKPESRSPRNRPFRLRPAGEFRLSSSRPVGRPRPCRPDFGSPCVRSRLGAFGTVASHMGPWLAHSAALLRRRPGLASRDPHEAQHIVARALNRHATSWGRGPVDTALHRIAINDVSIILLRYGAPVKIEPLRPGTYYIVQIPLDGEAQIRCGGSLLDIDPENGVVLSPNARIMLEWAPRCEQILIKIPVATVE